MKILKLNFLAIDKFPFNASIKIVLIFFRFFPLNQNKRILNFRSAVRGSILLLDKAI